ncbi:MAG TPA: hypothetical protein VJB14_05975 [Planctomycetota bacterium]|nr:hypothetical protein [Planctomycetota bacterium]
MKASATAVFTLLLAAAAGAQDQQLGARTKAMGGSYTAFEDDPVSVWLNPAGISTQTTAMSIAYQTYVTYPLHEEQAPGAITSGFSAEAETTFVDPAFIPSYLGFVFHLGGGESPMALGICYARPYHLNYSFDKVADPTQTVFTADSNVDQSFSRFRVAFGKDFRFAKSGESGWFTHLSAGAAVDIGYERWEFKSAARSASDNATGFGGGAGLLLGLFDDGESFKVNVGMAWQSPLRWDFSIDPDIAPAFNMPQQLNAGVTFYLLKGFPLRATVDVQWIEWSETADVALFDGRSEFEDVVNFSVGFEYRIEVAEKVSLFPRLGYRRFDAPWGDKDDLPMTGSFQLVLDTRAGEFNLATFGIGVGWTAEDGKVRSVDLGADAGGDSYSFALGFNYEF